MPVGPRSGGPGISCPMASRPGLEFREPGRLEAAGGSELLDHRLELRRATRAGPRPRPAGAAWGVHRIPRRSRCRRVRPRPPRRRPRAGRRGAGACAPGAPRAGGRVPVMARRRRPTGPSVPSAESPRLREHLGDLEPPAKPGALGRARVLEGDLVLTTPTPGADHEAGARDAPVVGVDVGVDQPSRRARQSRERSRGGALEREGGQGGQPTLHGSQVERVELPLDLGGYLPVPGFLVGRRGHRAQATAHSWPQQEAIRTRCTGRRRGGGKLRDSGATSR